MTRIKLIYILAFLTFAAGACKKDETELKVSAPAGKIVINALSVKEIFTITDLITIVKGDTTSIKIEALNADSTQVLFIGFNKIGNFGVKKYPITGAKVDTAISQVYMFKIEDSGTGGAKTTFYEEGSFEILEYVYNDNIQCKFSFLIPSVNPDAQETGTGEMYVSYALLDPNRVPNLSITPSSAVVNINKLPTFFSYAYAGFTVIQDMKQIIVTANTTESQKLTISFIDFMPRINKTYEVGKTIVEGQDSLGVIEVVYVDEKGIVYKANDETGGGKVIVTKITNATIQGKFDVVAAVKGDTAQRVSFSEGLFYARLKNYNKK